MNKNDELYNRKLHGLRGIAIISVLFFHFYPSIFKSGFIGVDLFFILSGYLVTKSVLREITQTNPSLKKFLLNFYTKRFARIYPLLILSVFTSFFFALLFTTDKNLPVLLRDTSFAIMGISNIGFYNSSFDYFATNQMFNFFTQTWSLGIEEQFYVVFSFLIILVYFRSAVLFKRLIFLFVVLSFTAMLFTKDKNATFYLLHLRFWELGVGVMLALSPGLSLKKTLSKNVEQGLVFLLFLLFMFSSRRFFPLPYLIPVFMISIVLIINSTQKGPESWLNSKVLNYFGDISYSLYLVHWIIHVLINHIFPYSYFINFLGLVMSVFISHLTYFKIEVPSMRYFRKSQNISIFLLVLVFLAAISVYLSRNNFNTNLLYLPRLAGTPVAEGWSGELLCHGKEKLKKISAPFEFCLKPREEGPTVFLGGDSHASQLYFGLEELFKDFAQVKYIVFEGEEDVYAFTRGFDQERNDVFDKILEFSKKGDFAFFTFAQYRMLSVSDGSLEKATRMWRYYLKELIAKDVRVFLVYDNPMFDKFVPLERCIINHLIFGSKTCDISLKDAESFRERQSSFFDSFLDIGVKKVDLFPFFCNKNVCSMFSGEKVLYFDSHHYTKETSLSLATFIEEQIELNVNIFENDIKKHEQNNSINEP